MSFVANLSLKEVFQKAFKLRTTERTFEGVAILLKE